MELLDYYCYGIERLQEIEESKKVVKESEETMQVFIGNVKVLQGGGGYGSWRGRKTKRQG